MQQHGLISQETAMAMAQAARRHFGADAGIGVTGIAGTEPVEGKRPGTCYVAAATPAGTEVRTIRRPGRRDVAKRFFAQSALDLLRLQLLRMGEGSR
jgi:nicotinamide mononucleotide (NMN) deamidase PncC